jgi:hypothetical protein
MPAAKITKIMQKKGRGMWMILFGYIGNFAPYISHTAKTPNKANPVMMHPRTLADVQGYVMPPLILLDMFDYGAETHEFRATRIKHRARVMMAPPTKSILLSFSLVVKPRPLTRGGGLYQTNTTAALRIFHNARSRPIYLQLLPAIQFAYIVPGDQGMMRHKLRAENSGLLAVGMLSATIAIDMSSCVIAPNPRKILPTINPGAVGAAAQRMQPSTANPNPIIKIIFRPIKSATGPTNGARAP